MGLADRLVGVTRYCTRPPEVVATIPKVGGTKDVDVGKIDGLAPDVILANSEENRPEDIEALSRRHRVHVSQPRRVRDVPALVRGIAEAAGAPGAGDALAAEIEREGARPMPDEAFRYAYFIWKDPWMTVSGDTYVSDLFLSAGGANVFAGGANVFAGESDRYPEVSPAQVLAAEPDVLFFSSEPYPFEERHRPAIEAAFGSSRPIELVDGDDCCWHGARTRQGLKLMGELGRRFGKS